ncbi:glycosyltransferase [uncultured Thiohalocapsa sp.]|uniref:glycosyltransferase n=1 Tax=uncultured Thiohalocapsa sp. TaxID=768990 RepID=UPI0025E991FA|nr:glycosyltransferase [uncultured Thiohalocapsa sp.]
MVTKLSDTGDGGYCPPASVYVVVVNWNGWAQTLACLESLYRLRTPGARVIVCDNGSTDDSARRIVDWASGRLDVLPERGPLRRLSHPPTPKPLPHRVVSASPDAAGQDGAHRDQAWDRATDATAEPLTLIVAEANRGFGAGCNLGIRYALARGDCDALWLLNNDTLVDPDALDALLLRLAEPGLAMCGSTLLHQDAPHRIQCQAGARFYRLASLSRFIGKDRARHRALPAARVERQLDHLYGASMLVTRAFIEQAGLLPEDYFLYYEEMDWTLRGGVQWRLGYAQHSLVYHRKGASAGTGTRRRGRDARARYRLAHSRLRFTRIHRPRLLPVIQCLLLLEALACTLRRRWPQVRALLRALRETAPPARRERCGREITTNDAKENRRAQT